MPQSKRITISGRNLEFLQDLATQMDETDLTAALAYLLTDVRGLGYKFGDKPLPKSKPIGYQFDPTTFETAVAPLKECDRNYQEVDPIIARMSSLIEEF